MANAEEIQELKKKILTRYKNAGRVKANELVMARVPLPSIQAFKEYANSEFCGDYGMCFRDLIEKRLVLEPSLNSIIQMIQELDDRISNLEGKGIVKPKRIIKTVGKRRIVLPNKEE